MKKMIVVDLDGTLLNENKQVSENSIRYLKRLKEEGYIITIATGRVFTSILSVTNNAVFANYIITDTGASCYDNQQKRFLFENFLSEDVVKKSLSFFSDECVSLDICVPNKYYKYSSTMIENNPCVEIIKDKEFLLKKCQKVTHISFVMKNNKSIIELYPKLRKEFPDLEIIIMQDSDKKKKWIEITPPGCTKYNAIHKLASDLQIQNEDIIAFGDSLNDIEMLKKCGTGIAMQNALIEVKEVADGITKYPNTKDGIIRFLEEYLK